MPEMTLHRVQIQYWQSPALFRGFVGGIGSGKSFGGAADLIMRAKRGRTYMAIGPTYKQLKDSTLRSFGAVVDKMGLRSKFRWAAADMVAHLGGAEILFRSADNPESLRGPNLSGVWLDEASLMDEMVYQIAIGRLREAGDQGWLGATFTPKGRGHWTFQVFAAGRPDTAIFFCRTSENPFLPPDFAATLSHQYHGLFAAQELDGQFVNLGGAEWPPEFFGDEIWFDDWPAGTIVLRVLALDPSKGVKDQTISNAAKNITADYSAFVMLAVDQQNNLWVDADLDNRRPTELVEGTVGRSIVGDGLALCKSFQPDAFVVETNNFQQLVANSFLRESAKARIHIPLYSIESRTNKQARIRTLGSYFAQRQIRVRRSPGGQMLVQQCAEFPAGLHDDGPDALKMAEDMANYLLFGPAASATCPVLIAG